MQGYILGNQQQWVGGAEEKHGWTPSCAPTASAPSHRPRAAPLWQYCEKHHKSHAGPGHQGLCWRLSQKPRGKFPLQAVSSSSWECTLLLSASEFLVWGLQNSKTAVTNLHTNIETALENTLSATVDFAWHFFHTLLNHREQHLHSCCGSWQTEAILGLLFSRPSWLFSWPKTPKLKILL